METSAMLQILDEVAEEVIRPRFRALETGDVEQKGTGDFVTVADREAELAIAERLKALAPGALLVGEEATFYSQDAMRGLATAELAYTIDPIDGTRNFVNGCPEYALMVAEVRCGLTTRSWIWQPEFQRSYVAELGAGLWRNDERLEALERERLPIGAASSRRYHGHMVAGAIAPVISTAWSAAFDYPNLLEGATDYAYYRKIMPWDHLPGALMVRELGGVSRLSSGQDYQPGVEGLHLIVAMSEPIWAVANQHWPWS